MQTLLPRKPPARHPTVPASTAGNAAVAPQERESGERVGRPSRRGTKVLVALKPQVVEQLEHSASDRGITIQELVRAVIIPEWARKLRNANNG